MHEWWLTASQRDTWMRMQLGEPEPPPKPPPPPPLFGGLPKLGGML